LFEFRGDSVNEKRDIVGALRSTGLRPTFLDKFEKRNITLPAGLFQAPNGHAAGQLSPMTTRLGSVR